MSQVNAITFKQPPALRGDQGAQVRALLQYQTTNFAQFANAFDALRVESNAQDQRLTAIETRLDALKDLALLSQNISATYVEAEVQAISTKVDAIINAAS